MSKSRSASNPISYRKHPKQYYVTRGGKRIYLGSDKQEAIKKYHILAPGIEPVQQEFAPPVEITIKELANRFIAAQRANWRNPKATLKCSKDRLGRFTKDQLRAFNQADKLHLFTASHSLVPPSATSRDFFYTSEPPESRRQMIA